jgi:Aminomethyltransferase folate-binding domain
MTESLKAVVLSDRKIVAISGTDRVKFLQGLMTNDIRRLAPDRALYAGFLTGQGKLLCDAFVFQDGDRILIDIATAFVEDFVKRLSAFKLREAVEIVETALAVAVVWGSGAAARLELESVEGLVGNRMLAEVHLAFVDPRIAAFGVRLIYPADFPIEAELARLGFAGATAADYAGHRLTLGIADTAEIGGEICYPLEAKFRNASRGRFQERLLCRPGTDRAHEAQGRIAQADLAGQRLGTSAKGRHTRDGQWNRAGATDRGLRHTGPCLAPSRSSGRRKRRFHPRPGRAAHRPLAELATALNVATYVSDAGPRLPGATLSHWKTRLTGADSPDQ